MASFFFFFAGDHRTSDIHGGIIKRDTVFGLFSRMFLEASLTNLMKDLKRGALFSRDEKGWLTPRRCPVNDQFHIASHPQLTVEKGRA